MGVIVVDERKVLGRDVIPIHYAVKLEPNLKTFRYNGNVIVKLRIRKSTKSITLNAGDKLKIKSGALYQKKYKESGSFIHDKKGGLLTFTFTKAAKGAAELSINFQGVNDDTLYGFCRTKYYINGKKHYNLSTDCEPANARHVFPCFDEPELKATMAFSLVIDRNLEAVSNMPVKGENKLKGGKRLVVFETTPRMSTYLHYLGVGKYDVSEGKYRNINLRVLATPGKKKLTVLPLAYLKKFLAFQEKYFGIKFALPKLDLIAVPDFSHGAMENWGAITFRETALLDDIRTATESSKARIAEVIAHELAHQWFGDLVTMKWWDEIWLNESFADFMEFKTVDAIFPQWQTMKKYFITSIGAALSADQLKTTHPIHVNVNNPEELGAIFDAISYEKGSSVLTMLEAVVGKETFKKGLHSYLNKNKYGNAEGKDLWEAVQKASVAAKKKLPVSLMMKEWTEKPGYPIVDVKKTNSFKISQKRFTLLKEYNDKPWPLPIMYLTENGSGSTFLKESNGEIKSDSAWIKLNYGQKCFYRVRYDEQLLRELSKKIKEGALGDEEIFGIENDLFALASTGRIPLDEYINFINSNCMGCGFPANVSITGHLSWINNIAFDKPFVYKARRCAIAFNRRTLGELGWVVRPRDGMVEIMTRNSAIVGLGDAGDREAIAKAEGMLQRHFSGKEKLNPNIIMPIYILSAMNGNDGLFARFLRLYQNAPIPADKINGLKALAMFRDPKIIEKALELSLTGAIRLQDKVVFAMLMPSNPAARRMLWEWQKKNWKKLMKMYGPSINMLDKNVDASEVLSDERSRDDFVEFFRKKENRREDISMIIEQTTERIESNIAFINANTASD